MAEFQAGEVVVPVVPSARDFIRDLKKQVLPGAYGLGQSVGKDIQRGIKDAMGGVYDSLKEQTQRQQAQAPKDGATVGGAFAQGFKRAVESALRALPKIEVDADTSPAQAQIQNLRARMEALSAKTVGIDIDAGAAQAELAAIQRELSSIDGRSVSADLRMDIASALAELAAVEAGISRVDGRTANARVDVDVAGALASIGLVTAALAALPAVATVAFGAAGVAGAAIAAGVGIGALAAVAVPSLTRISEASKANEAAMKAASSATSGAAGAAQQAAIQSLNLAAAEQRVADAKRTALAAEQELTRARIEAKRAAEDLALASRNAALSEEDALLGVEEARQRLAEVSADPKTSELEYKRAELAVRQAKQRAKEATLRNKRQQAEQKAADKAGIEGSSQVVAAKDKIAQANKRVEDAERQLRVMQLQQAAAAKQQAASTGGVVAQMVKLSPAAQVAAKQIEAFKNAYEGWQKRLEPAVLPAVTGALKVLQGLFKPLEPLIKGTSAALVGLEQSASKALGGKFWTSFFKDLSTAAPTAVTGLGKSLGNITTGVAGMIKAFLPFTGTIVGGIQKATAAFSTWGQNLGKSEGFKAFVAYVKANWPAVQTLFSNVAAVVKNLIVGLAPLGSGALSGLSGIASLLAKMPPETLAAIATAVGAVALGVKAWGISQKILNVALSANPIGLIITAIGLLVAGLTYAYQQSETFRQIVDAAFQAVGQAVSWAWENVMKPALEALVTFWNTVLAPALQWLWQNVIVPAWNGISAAVTVAWNSVIKPALQALWNFIVTTLAPKIIWLWENVIKPAFAKAGEAIKAAWTLVIQPALKALWSFITETLAPKIAWLYENVIKPAFSKIGQVISDAWTKVILPVFNFLKDFITKDIPNAFEKGVSLVGTAWTKIQDMAKKPVNFIIGTVYNGGIVKLWNTVADALGLELKLKEIPQLATGGIYPGYTPGRDIGLAAVSGGEAIMRPEWTRAVGPGFVDQANKAARSGGVAGAAKFMGGFANGGIIDGLIGAGVKAGSEAFLNPLLDKAAAAMGNSPWAKMLVGVPKRMIAEVVAFLAKKDAETGGLSGGKAVQYAREQIGKPYEWGATGPNSFDCSGLVMRALQAAGVKGVPRVTQDQINWVEPVAKPQAGMLGFPH
ncbi:NlpC/P60 family protein, partial [Streptosporangium sp. NPDC049644]